MIQRSWFQSPLGAICEEFIFCSSLYKDLSDNLTETPIVKNSNVIKKFEKKKGCNKLINNSKKENGCIPYTTDNLSQIEAQKHQDNKLQECISQM